MVVARAGHTATLLQDGRVLVAGGSNGGVASTSMEVYDPAQGTWRSVGNMRWPRVSHTAALLATGQVMLIGSASVAAGDPSAGSVELYEPITGAREM